MAYRKKDYDAVIDSPLGRLGIEADVVLTSIDFVTAKTPRMLPRTHLARRVCAELRAYFRNPHAGFTVPVAVEGSAFQNAVWKRMRRIPSGAVQSYGDLARQLKTAPRAVGGACRANPVPIIVPCHRVVSVSGLGGFMGATGGRAMQIKRWLLDHERRG
ncbi:MAG: methylated-DNA--[protein]-cysteine S-methyltransferase [Gammaproteobacteria bacterium]|nr:methylated-DNA--[protein]-cysteine S-methyltransferase [Gammaproteobacteria bacterium]